MWSRSFSTIWRSWSISASQCARIFSLLIRIWLTTIVAHEDRFFRILTLVRGVVFFWKGPLAFTLCFFMWSLIRSRSRQELLSVWMKKYLLRIYLWKTCLDVHVVLQIPVIMKRCIERSRYVQNLEYPMKESWYWQESDFWELMISIITHPRKIFRSVKIEILDYMYRSFFHNRVRDFCFEWRNHLINFCELLNYSSSIEDWTLTIYWSVISCRMRLIANEIRVSTSIR